MHQEIASLLQQIKPMDALEAEALGISQDVFLLEIERFSMPSMKRTLLKDVEVLKRNAFFIHGFFGDQTIFGRRASEYLPTRCWRVQAHKNSNKRIMLSLRV